MKFLALQHRVGMAESLAINGKLLEGQFLQDVFVIYYILYIAIALDLTQNGLRSFRLHSKQEKF